MSKKVSIIIPSCNEIYLQKTIDNILLKAKEEIEIIAFLDGYWSNPIIKDDPRVILIHSSIQKGMNYAINAMSRVATGKYIMKLDAHCILGEEFDRILKENHEDNWISVPRRYDLMKDTWTRGKKITDYMYITPPNKKKNNENKVWDRGFHGVRYNIKNRENILIDDLMTFQGSCWFMTKDLFKSIDGLDYGYFWHEAQQLGNKVWLSGGRVVRNKNTWYAHLHKGKEMGRGYYLSRNKGNEEAKEIIDLWMNNKWPKQIKKFQWLVEKFMPILVWENWNWEEKWNEI